MRKRNMSQDLALSRGDQTAEILIDHVVITMFLILDRFDTLRDIKNSYCNRNVLRQHQCSDVQAVCTIDALIHWHSCRNEYCWHAKTSGHMMLCRLISMIAENNDFTAAYPSMTKQNETPVYVIEPMTSQTHWSHHTQYPCGSAWMASLSCAGVAGMMREEPTGREDEERENGTPGKRKINIINCW